MDPLESYLPQFVVPTIVATLPGPGEDLRSSLAAHRLTFCAIRRIRKRTIGWISQVIVLLLLTVFSAFHVPAFQRNHRKRLAPFFWNALRVQLRRPLCLLTQTLPFTHVHSHSLRELTTCAKQASPISPMGCVV